MKMQKHCTGVSVMPRASNSSCDTNIVEMVDNLNMKDLPSDFVHAGRQHTDQTLVTIGDLIAELTDDARRKELYEVVAYLLETHLPRRRSSPNSHMKRINSKLRTGY
jgi:hypothetical protein